jgi:hypothetical protein
VHDAALVRVLQRAGDLLEMRSVALELGARRPGRRAPARVGAARRERVAAGAASP